MSTKLLESHDVRGRHVSMAIEADEVEVEADELVLLRGPAEAARDAVAADIRAIAEPAQRGDHKLFNVTGTLAANIEVQPDQSAHALDVVPPPNRLEDPAVVERLVDAVPSLRDPLPSTEAALEESANGAVRGSR